MLPSARPVGVVLIIGVAALAMTGCASGDEPATPPPSSAASTTPPKATSTTADDRSPIDRYLGIEADDAATAHAEIAQATSACLATKGITVSTTLLLDPVEGAATTGYGLFTGADDAVVEPTEGMDADERAAYDLAMFGAPDQNEPGCLPAAQTASKWLSFQESDAYLALMDDLAAIADEADATEAVTQATADWAACMATAGYPYTSPVAAYRAVEDRYLDTVDHPVTDTENADLKKWEVDVALADAACNKQAGLDDARNTAINARQEEYIAGHRPVLDALKEAYAAAKPQ